MKIKVSFIVIIIGASVIVGMVMYKPTTQIIGKIKYFMTYDDNMLDVQMYDPIIDPYEKLRTVVDEADNKGKLVLLVFGANWCPDCRSLFSKMQTKPLNKTINKNFIVMHVDIGRWDNNIDFSNQFGEPVKLGIPSIAILDSSSTVYYVSNAGEFASARSSKTKTLNDWFLDRTKKIKKAQQKHNTGNPVLN